MAIRKTTLQFIKKASIIHKGKYDYSLSKYTMSNKKLDIICPIHGVFTQTAHDHLAGSGCIKCFKAKRTHLANIIAPIGTKLIPLTKGKYAIVDEKDYEKVVAFEWTTIVGRNTNYAVGYVNGVSIKMHRFILDVQDKKVFVDHINGNGLDNQKSNLRLCNNSENCRNNISKRKFKGVYKVDKNKNFIAAMLYQGKRLHIGMYKTAEEAALAYNKKALELYGDFAKLNVVPLSLNDIIKTV